MDEAVLVQGAEALAHVEDHVPAVGLIAAGPDEDTRMILVALVDGLDTVQKQGLKLAVVLRDDALVRVPLIPGQSPGAVSLHVGLVDHIQAVAVAEGVERRIVGVVAGTDGVDVMALHGDDVALKLCMIRHASGAGVEVVAVDALEDDALAV